MNESWLDSFARQIAMRATSRRGVARLGIVGLLEGAILGGGRPGAAGCTKVNKRCEKSGECCRDSRCRKGKCHCTSGLTACAGKCRDLQTDTAHCGGCDQRCAAGQVCASGTCECPSGQKPCQGQCIPTANCCIDTDCPSGQACSSGACTCPSGQTLCNGTCIASNTCCTVADCSGGQLCPVVGQPCCTPQGFGDESVCSVSTVCCDGGVCVNNGFGRMTCRPAGCILSGGSCGAGCPGACCSLTSSGGICQ